MTIGDNARVERNVEEAARGCGQPTELARVSPTVEGHPVAVPEIRSRLESVHPPDDTISPSPEVSDARVTCVDDNAGDDDHYGLADGGAAGREARGCARTGQSAVRAVQAERW